MRVVLLIILIVLLVGAASHWGLHDRGYAPMGGVGLILLVLVVLLILGII